MKPDIDLCSAATRVEWRSETKKNKSFGGISRRPQFTTMPKSLANRFDARPISRATLKFKDTKESTSHLIQMKFHGNLENCNKCSIIVRFIVLMPCVYRFRHLIKAIYFF